MAGQSVGLVTCEQSVAEILDEMVGQALTVIDGQRWASQPAAMQPRAAGGRDRAR
jgi:hypothetical protein